MQETIKKLKIKSNNDTTLLCGVDYTPKYVAQGLLKTWKEKKLLNTSTSGVIPLEDFLRFNYEERYVKLCERLSVKPCSFGAWLRKPISNII